jgi:hypothetical protein
MLLRATLGKDVGSCGIGTELACRRSADTVTDACIYACVYSVLGAHVSTRTRMAAQCRLDHAFIQDRPCNVALQLLGLCTSDDTFQNVPTCSDD